jgi:general secretion pathway protein C
MLLRRIVSLAVPTTAALAAFLHAQAIGALVSSAIPPYASAPVSIAPFAEAHAASRPSADAILERNAFDHATGSLVSAKGSKEDVDLDPASAPPCDGVRAAVTVRDDDADASFAAIEAAGKQHLRRRGDALDDLQVVFVGDDRVWLTRGGKLCQATVFGPTPVQAPAAASGSALDQAVAGKIVKTGANEYQIDRGAVDRVLDAQAELMKTPIAPDKEGDRVVGLRLLRVRPGSALAALGLETNDRLVAVNGIEVTSTEKMLEAYARLKTGTLSRLTLEVVRNGKRMSLDYEIR